jgi:ribonuclease III
MTPPISVELDELETRLDYRFRERELLQQSLTHKSFAHESGGNQHNESMEFLGDAVLGFLVTDFIYRDFPALSEGRKSKIKAYLVSAATLSTLALELDLPRYLRLGRGEEKTGGRKKKALSANAFEAVVAAIYLDSGIDAVRRFLDPLFRPLIGDVRDGRAAVEDPKTALQEYLQARELESAQYVVTAETGPEHRKTFHVDLRIGGSKVSSATGPTKKHAELLAAQAALARLLRNVDAGEGSEG